MKIVISGSMTYAEEMLRVAEQLRGIRHTRARDYEASHLSLFLFLHRKTLNLSVRS